MILYMDASALVKRYIDEYGTDQVNTWIDAAEMVCTGIITRVEVSAAIALAGRMNLIRNEEALAVLRQFRAEWESIQRLPVNENTVIRGDALAYEHNLRGYDATHLACALIWRETLGLPVTMASFDRQLIGAARVVKLDILPKD
jgi:predicted nucleic acid-binding protein